ncbi:MAG: hypothetical protein KIT87_19310 [Anaerolineae bacterium]|nr:hypothetical protein [Anaerolineae bacterium]
MYKSYLLRLWRDNSPGAAWRATLESITEPTERRYFADLDSLVAFLLTHVTGTGRSPPEEDHC